MGGFRACDHGHQVSHFHLQVSLEWLDPAHHHRENPNMLATMSLCLPSWQAHVGGHHAKSETEIC